MSIIHWLIATLGIIVAAFLIPGVEVGFFSALVTALVLGALNVFVKPVLLFLSLPVNILTLGLFTLVINALLVMIASFLVPGFKVSGWGSALLFGLALAIVNAILFSLLKP